MTLTGPAPGGAQATEPEAGGPDAARQEDSSDIEKFSAGVRVGWADHRNKEFFRSYQAFLNWYLPWAWRPKSGWIFALRLDFTGAAVNGAGTTGFLGSVGPSVSLRKKGWKAMLEGGVSPAFLSEDSYGKEDLSGHIQFVTHVGIFLLPFPHLGVGYQFQHMSNADIQQPNPGLNIHSAEINYRF